MSSDAPLPPGWTKAWSNSQKKHYWHHVSTKTSQWHPPTATEAANPLVAKRRAEEKTEAEHGTAHPPAKKKARPSSLFSTSASSALDAISVAIIVPYRDLHPGQNRAAHLAQFHPHMVKFLSQNPKVSDYKVFIVEQSDDGRKVRSEELARLCRTWRNSRLTKCFPRGSSTAESS